ncbi:PREDICTED: cornifin alpha-like [Calidris pugnax]|uniref:cornifin alpha-like n=1 Tax=Calidris pugnax TaxID=198806 RepID=UPI00071D20CE|nr:PREDICTED: cornifin alpha-like [Calidris pugnax]
MAYYGYQYKQQCYIPSGVKHNTPVFTQCHSPSAVKCTSCTPCDPKGAKLCTVRKTMQTSPKCSVPCPSGCVETHLVEGPSSSCCPMSPDPCAMAFPQPQLQGMEHLCIPHCGQSGLMRFPQICAPAQVSQNSSYPYSYQWSKSYQYNCGPQ